MAGVENSIFGPDLSEKLVVALIGKFKDTSYKRVGVMREFLDKEAEMRETLEPGAKPGIEQERHRMTVFQSEEEILKGKDMEWIHKLMDGDFLRGNGPTHFPGLNYYQAVFIKVHLGLRKRLFPEIQTPKIEVKYV